MFISSECLSQTSERLLLFCLINSTDGFINQFGREAPDRDSVRLQTLWIRASLCLQAQWGTIQWVDYRATIVSVCVTLEPALTPNSQLQDYMMGRRRGRRGKVHELPHVLFQAWVWSVGSFMEHWLGLKGNIWSDRQLWIDVHSRTSWL